ncbi:hypothetical protein DFS34DRAFT_149561 [Phlyctochytrium arcticum]|nr:hypothetical protein DFS34DRAFT_149561 [Phlyctochytrium arcticum]
MFGSVNYNTMRSIDPSLLDPHNWTASLMPDKARVYKRFIDSYRLRVEDEMVFSGVHRGLYNLEEGERATGSLKDFKRYIKKAQDRKMFPSWWTSADTDAMLTIATTDKCANIKYATEKSDMTEHYGYIVLWSI